MGQGKEVQMSIMDSIGKPKDRPVLVTICGDAGMGKTSLAAAFPRPIVIRAEDGLQAIPADRRPDAFPVVQKAEQLWDQITAIIHQPHDYQTLIIDSVTALDRLFIADVLTQDGKAKSIQNAHGGYGRGYDMVSGMHHRLRKGAGLANERRGMHVVFIAHATVETIKTPDTDDYMRYCMRLHDKSQPPYLDDVDIVGFVRLEMFTKGDEGERKKAVSTGDRELICHAVASNISKNRYGITEALPFRMGENPLAAVIPALGGRAPQSKPAPAWGENEGTQE
jgi:hypothetical protein